MVVGSCCAAKSFCIVRENIVIELQIIQDHFLQCTVKCAVNFLQAVYSQNYLFCAVKFVPNLLMKTARIYNAQMIQFSVTCVIVNCNP